MGGFLYVTDKPRPEDLARFFFLSKGYHHYDHLSISHHRLLNLPDTRNAMKRWRSIQWFVRKTPCISSA